MTDSQTTETNDNDVAFRRRELLRAAGAAGVIGTFGAGIAGAQPPDRLIVGTTPGRADIARRKATQVHRTLDFDSTGQVIVGQWPEEALRVLRRNPHVRYVEPDTEGTRLAQTLPWSVDRIDAEIAHANGDTGNTIDVGIIDSGIDSDHADLAANLGQGFALAAECFSCDESWDDVDGHGTAIAGIVGAVDNTIGVVGVAPQATLHALKDGDTSPRDSATAAALETAADEGYDVVNISSSMSESTTLNDAIDYAVSHDVVVVASAGNAGPCTDCVSFPARHPDVIAVSATNDTDGFAEFSSQGPEVDLTAPGVAVPSTALGGGTSPESGNSFSTPHVTAAVAQVLANGTSPSNVRSVLQNTAEDIGLTSNRQGAGLLDVASALDYDPVNDILEVETDAADDLGFTEATLNGEVTELSGIDSVAVGFEWGEVGAGFPTTTSAGILSGTGTFDAPFTGLEKDTDYEFRAFATATDNSGDSSTERGGVVTFSPPNNLPPSASFTRSPAVPDPGETVTFTSTATDPEDDTLTYEWNFTNDGGIDATGQTVTHSYSSPRVVTVRHRVIDEFGQSDETTETIRVNAPPEARFSVVTESADGNESISLDATASEDTDGSIASYKWDFEGTGTFDAEGPTPSHTYTTGGDKTVTLRVTDNDGMSAQVSKTVHISTNGQIDVQPNETDPATTQSKNETGPATTQGKNETGPATTQGKNGNVTVQQRGRADAVRIGPSKLGFGDLTTVAGDAGSILTRPVEHIKNLNDDGGTNHFVRSAILGVLGVVALAGTVSGYTVSGTRSTADQAAISEEKAINIAENEVGGEAQSVCSPVYEVQIKQADGTIMEVGIDGYSGDVLEVKTPAGPEQEEVDADAEAELPEQEEVDADAEAELPEQGDTEADDESEVPAQKEVDADAETELPEQNETDADAEAELPEQDEADDEAETEAAAGPEQEDADEPENLAAPNQDSVSRCAALTAKGRRCKLSRNSDSDLCHVHERTEEVTRYDD
jgi:subtilisin